MTWATWTKETRAAEVAWAAVRVAAVQGEGLASMRGVLAAEMEEAVFEARTRELLLQAQDIRREIPIWSGEGGDDES